ncbi:MAG: SxtJ family membrane protein [Pseudomonadota bacterium]
MSDTGKHGGTGKTPSRRQAIDTGMALTLICLIGGLLTGNVTWFWAATGALLVNMTFAGLYRLPARVWFGFSALLGTVMSKVILTVIFLGLVTPLALLRRLLGHDPMQLGQWKNGTGSAFVARDHRFTARDIQHPF